MKRIIVFLLLISLQFTSKAQSENKQTEPVKHLSRYATEQQINRGLNWNFEDTTLAANEIYHPLYKNLIAFQDLGFILSPSQNLQFNINRNTGFNLCENPYSIYFKRPETAKYYNTRVPVADFAYTQGPNALLMLNAKFAVNATPRLNFGVDFSRITQDGFYLRQFTSGYFTQAHTNYYSKSKKYRLLANLNWNRGVHDENGGIQSDSLFETLTGTNKSVPVYLNGSQSRFKQMNFQARQYYYLGKTSLNITEDEDSIYEVNPVAYVSHTLNYEYEQYFFDNILGDSAYLFPAYLLDSNLVFSDSVGKKVLNNRFAFGTWKTNDKQDLFAETGINLQNIGIHTYSGFRNEFNVIADGLLERVPKSKTDYGLKLKGQLCLLGYNIGDFQAHAELKLVFKGLDFTGAFSNYLYKADEVLLNYRSNPFIWNNNYSKINVSRIRGNFSTISFRHNFNIEFNSYLLNNWVYFGKDVNPIQTNEVISVNSITLNKTFQFGFLFLENALLYQTSSSSAIRLPEFSAKLRWYVSGNLFKKALKFQLGAAFWFNTAYYGNAWNPSARAFYIQDKTSIGNYPVLDVFLTGEIKKAILFIKLEHTNMDWMNGGYYYTPSYPLPIRALRTGVKWRMYN